MKIFYTRRAAIELGNLAKEDQKRIASKMRFYESLEDPLKFAERLTDYKLGQFRFRIGHHRIIFDIAGDKIFVLKIARRDKVYK